MNTEPNTKSLGEKLWSALGLFTGDGAYKPSWDQVEGGVRADWERVALRFAASLSHDETATAVITDLLQRLQAAKEREEKLVNVVERAYEELRLIRAKDCNAIYDTTLRLDMALALKTEEV